ncbi:MAG: hypothetical protein ACRDP7_44100, partial [Trebonia sp.]
VATSTGRELDPIRHATATTKTTMITTETKKSTVRRDGPIKTIVPSHPKSSHFVIELCRAAFSGHLNSNAQDGH